MMTEYDRMVKELRAAGHNVGPAKPRAKTTRQIVREEIAKYEAAMIKAVGHALGDAMREVEQRLRAEITAKNVRYAGAWTEGKSYRAGDLTTLGAIWHCDRDTSARPGSNGDWSVFLARPRDGKDGEPREQRTTRSHRSNNA